MTDLIICEKPSAAKKIAECLSDAKLVKKAMNKVPYYVLTHNGKEIIVACAVGHLYTIAQTDNAGWTYPVFNVGWKPTYLVDKDNDYVKAYIDTLEKLAEEADEFTIACDYDIEGEVIGLNAMRFACGQKDAQRMKFSTLTKPDLREAYDKKSKHLDWGQALAGETRHILDWYYGINLSRALTASLRAVDAFKVMSIGRVQGPAIKLLVDRELEIQKFIAEPFWQLRMVAKKSIESFHEKDKFTDKKEVEAVFKKIEHEKEAVVRSIEKKKVNQAPPHPFDLTTLQTESFAHFKLSPKETLEVAQRLYIAGLISYPRTSSQQLDPKLGFSKILEHLAKQKEYSEFCALLLKAGDLNPNNGKKTDPAHPAIFPTGAVPGVLSPRDRKVYDLIVKRFLATFGKPAVRETLRVTFEVKKELFIAHGVRTLDKQWHALYEPYVKLKEVELPEVAEGEQVRIDTLEKLEKETQPPKRYSQSSLVKELEKRNLGTKATRAEIIDTLFRRNYAEGDPIHATKIGIETVVTLQKYVPEILAEDLTREFEDDMDQIRSAKKTEDSKKTEEHILEKAKKHLIKILASFTKNEKTIGTELREIISVTREEERTVGQCIKCHQGKLKILHSKKTKKQFIACDRYPECEATFALPQGVLVKPTQGQCEACKSPVVLIIRKRSRPQQICINPTCPTKQTKTTIDRNCPDCGKELIVRRSFYGEFIGCSGYPACRHIEKIKKEGSEQKSGPTSSVKVSAAKPESSVKISKPKRATSTKVSKPKRASAKKTSTVKPHKK